MDKRGVLYGDFEVPEPIADLVHKGYFSTVSAEIIPDYKGHGPVLSATAMLGSQRPAVPGMGFTNTTILEEQTYDIMAFAAPINFDTNQDIFLALQSDLAFDFASGATVEYDVPVTEEKHDADGKVIERRTVVQHVRASSASEARGVLLRTVERIASTLGGVVAVGAGIITVRVGSYILRQWIIGDPIIREVVANIAGSGIFHGTGRTGFSDQPYKYSIGGTILMVIGGYAIGKALYNIIMEHQQTKARAHAQVWAPTPVEAESITRENLGPSWNIISASVVEGARTIFEEPKHKFALSGVIRLGKALYKKRRKLKRAAGTIGSVVGSVGTVGGMANEYRNRRNNYQAITDSLYAEPYKNPSKKKKIITAAALLGTAALALGPGRSFRAAKNIAKITTKTTKGAALRAAFKTGQVSSSLKRKRRPRQRRLASAYLSEMIDKLYNV
jgi:hypothetical protein